MALTITYSNGIVTVTGTSTSLFDQIYNASEANGWGIAYRADNGRGYYFNAHIYLGDGYTFTEIKENTTSVKNDMFIEFAKDKIFRIRANANYYCQRYGIYGKKFLFNSSSFNKKLFYTDNGSYFQLIGGTITGLYNDQAYYSNGVTLDFSGSIYFADCLIEGAIRYLNFRNSNTRLVRTSFIYTYYVRFYKTPDYNPDSVLFRKLYSGFDITVPGVELVGCEFSGNTTDIRLGGGANRTLYITSCKFSGTPKVQFTYYANNNWIIRRYKFQVHVKYSDGTPIENANVKIIANDPVFATINDVTNADGKFNDVKSIEVYRWQGTNPMTEYDGNPFRIEVEVDGYDKYIMENVYINGDFTDEDPFSIEIPPMKTGEIEIEPNRWQLIALPVEYGYWDNVNHKIVKDMGVTAKIKNYVFDQLEDKYGDIQNKIELFRTYIGDLNKNLTYVPGVTPDDSEHNFPLVYDDNGRKEVVGFWVKNVSSEAMILEWVM